MRDRTELWLSELMNISDPKKVVKFWYNEMHLLTELLASYDYVLTDMHSFSAYNVNDIRLRREEVQELWKKAHANYWSWKDGENV